jgi:K+:H+ antiporter
MTTHALALLFIDLAIIIVLARLLGVLATRLGQPAVIGEVLAGVFVLPLLVNGGIADSLFPTEVRSHLSALANVGVALFMFIVGMEFDRKLMRGQGSVAVSVAIAAMLVPLGLGVGLGFALAAEHGGGRGTVFVLFMGVATAITAFPVLARILVDRGMRRTPIGNLALGAAAIGDVLAWLLLAMVIALAGGGDQHPWRVLLVFPYLAVMFWVVRPLLRRLTTTDRVGLDRLALVVAGVLLSGAATELMGLHVIFGTFLFGVVMPGDGRQLLRTYVHDKMSELNTVMLLPIFFIVAGLKVDLSAFDSTGLGDLALILAVAITGKFASTFVAARLHGWSSRQASTLGVLMNTRGLTELIVLTVGLELNLIDERIYTLMVLMAIVTTAMAGPLLRLLYPPAHVERDTIPPEPAAFTTGR